MDTLLSYEHILQFIALITGLIYWQKLNPKYLRYVVLIMALTCINESVIIQLIINSQHKISQDIAYNIFSIFDMAIWIYIFYKTYAGSKMRMLLLILATIAFIYSIIDIFFITGIAKFHINSMMGYDLCILILAGTFLYNLLKKDYYHPLNDPIFWICSACIVYHSLLFLNFVTLWLPEIYWKQEQSNVVFNIVGLSANIFYYLLLSIAFITCISYRSRRISFQQ